MRLIITERQYKLLSEEIQSIPIYKNVQMVSKFFEKLRKEYPRTPEYVLKDVIESIIVNNPEELKWVGRYFGGEPMLALGDWWKELLKGPWVLKIIEVNPEDFTENTISAFIDREFGDVDAYFVKQDKERTDTQRKIVKGDGKNQPIIVVYDKKTDKYELIEGWHRTMSLLKLGDNGEDLKNWDKIKIRAYVNLNSNLIIQ
jgi:hypothetical protein